MAKLPEIKLRLAKEGDDYKPYARDPETLARTWALPGTKGLEHRIGGLEKMNITGTISQKLTDLAGNLGAVRQIPGKFQAGPSGTLDFKFQVDQDHFQVIGCDDQPHRLTVRRIESNAFCLPSAGGCVLADLRDHAVLQQLSDVGENRRHT